MAMYLWRLILLLRIRTHWNVCTLSEISCYFLFYLSGQEKGLGSAWYRGSFAELMDEWGDLGA